MHLSKREREKKAARNEVSVKIHQVESMLHI